MLHLLRSLLPKACPGCGKSLEGLQGLCLACRPQKAYVYSQSPLSEVKEPHLLCLGRFEGKLARAVKALKYGGTYELAECLAAPLAVAIPPNWHIQTITAVPLHPKRLAERGYNQSERVAMAMAAVSGIPYKTLLKRNRYTVQQAKLHALERSGNVEGAFEALDFVTENVLLVDDVTTTGTTILECSRVLKIAGASKVYFATIAK